MDVYLKKSCLQNIYSVRLFTEYLFRQQLFFRQSNPLSDKRLTGGYYLFI